MTVKIALLKILLFSLMLFQYLLCGALFSFLVKNIIENNYGMMAINFGVLIMGIVKTVRGEK